MEETTKSPLKSKTLWFAFITAALSLFYPKALSFIQGNEVLVMSVLAAVLRLVTKDKIVLSSRKTKA